MHTDRNNPVPVIIIIDEAHIDPQTNSVVKDSGLSVGYRFGDFSELERRVINSFEFRSYQDVRPKKVKKERKQPPFWANNWKKRK